MILRTELGDTVLRLPPEDLAVVPRCLERIGWRTRMPSILMLALSLSLWGSKAAPGSSSWALPLPEPPPAPLPPSISSSSSPLRFPIEVAALVDRFLLLLWCLCRKSPRADPMLSASLDLRLSSSSDALLRLLIWC